MEMLGILPGGVSCRDISTIFFYLPDVEIREGSKMKKIIIVSVFDGGKCILKEDLKNALIMHIERMENAKRIAKRGKGPHRDIAMRSYYENKAWKEQILDTMRGKFNIVVVRDYTNTLIPPYDTDIGE